LRDRLLELSSSDAHVEVEATWGMYQQMITAYRTDRRKAKKLIENVIASLRDGAPAQLGELITLGRTLTRRAGDVLAYFDRPGTSNGPTEAICECRSWLVWDWLVGWWRSCCPGCDSRSNWLASAVSFC
jgi:transposase